MEWEELNLDLLHLVVKKLGDISNFIRFRAVCKKWRLVAPTSDPPPTLPWFLERDPITENKCCYRFYSLYSNKTQNLNIPQAQDTRICFGSSCKYVQCMDVLESNISYPFMFLKLFDPLTGSKIPMPFTGPKVPIPLKDDSIVLRRQYIGPSHSYSPNSRFDGTGGAVAMMIGWNVMGYISLIALFRLDGENETTSMNKHILQKKIVIYETSMFVTKILDVPTGDVVSLEQRLRLTYLLEACGDVLGVVQNFKTSELDILLDKILFEVYRLEDVGTKTPRWVKMHDGIGDRMLFLEPRFRTGFCLNARYFDGFKGNCIYFKECNGTYIFDSITSLARFNIEDGTTQLLPAKFHGVWFFTSSDLLEACGEVLGVVWNFKTSELDILLDKILFEVYKLEDVGTKTPRWVKMHDGIGDRMLFLEPRFRTGFCLNARYFDGFKGNCIYFKECNGKYFFDSITSLAQFNIEDGTTQQLPVKFHGVWFVPHP